MEDNFTKVERIANQGYELEFGHVLDNAFANFKKIFGVAGISFILFCVILFAFLFGFIGIAYGFSDFASNLTGLNPDFMSGTTLIIFLLVTTLFSALLSPINAGFIRMAYLADINENFGVDTMFYYFKTKYFKDIFIATLLISIVTVLLSQLLEVLGFKIIGVLLTYVVYFFTFLTIPLIIFSDLTAVQAISMSFKLILKNPLIILGLLILSVVLVFLGIIALCIGIFFTMPFLFSMYYCIYKEILPLDKHSVLDEIGTSDFN
jgi:uncharacterized membrane protein